MSEGLLRQPLLSAAGLYLGIWVARGPGLPFDTGLVRCHGYLACPGTFYNTSCLQDGPAIDKFPEAPFAKDGDTHPGRGAKPNAIGAASQPAQCETCRKARLRHRYPGEDSRRRLLF